MVYIRRYAGPLRPGERSAYVPGTRYVSKRAQMAVKIQRKWRSYKARNPSRLTGSKTNYKVAKAVSKAMSLYGENKFNGENLDCIRAVAKPTGSQPLTYVFFNTGTRVDSLLPEFTSARAMDLYNFPKGDGPTERTGDYLYLRKTHLKLEVQMLPGSSEIANSLN